MSTKQEYMERIEEIFDSIIDETNEGIDQGADPADALAWAVSVAIANATQHKEEEYEPVDHEQRLMAGYRASCEALLD